MVVGEVEEHRGAARKAGVAAKPRAPHVLPGRSKNGPSEAAEDTQPITNNTNGTKASNMNSDSNALNSNSPYPASVLGGAISAAAVNVGAAGGAAAPVATSRGEHGSGFGGGENGNFVGGGGGRGDRRSSSRAVTGRPNLLKTPDVQGTEDMVERLTASARGGQVPRPPVRRQHPVHAAAAAAAAASAAPAAASFSNEARSPARQRHPKAGSSPTGQVNCSVSPAHQQSVASATVGVSEDAGSPARQQYGPRATAGVAGGGGGGGHGHGNHGGVVGYDPREDAGSSRFNGLGGEGGGGFVDVSESNGVGRRSVPPGFNGADIAFGIGANSHPLRPLPAQCNGAAATMGFSYSTASGASASQITADYPAAAGFSQAGQAFMPTFLASSAGVGGADRASAGTGFPYISATPTDSSAGLGYPETSTTAAAAAEYLASRHVGRAGMPAPIAPPTTGYPPATTTIPSAAVVYPDTNTTAASAAPAPEVQSPAFQRAMEHCRGPAPGTVGQPAVAAAAEQSIQSLFQTMPAAVEGVGGEFIGGKVPDLLGKSGGLSTGGDGWGGGGGGEGEHERAALPRGVHGVAFTGGVKGGDGGNVSQTMPAGAEGIGSEVGGDASGEGGESTEPEVEVVWGGGDKGVITRGFNRKVGEISVGGVISDQRVTGGNGAGGGGGATALRQPDPHVESVLKAAKCERFLPLFIAKQIDLQKLALMDEADFKKLEVC